MPWDGTELWVGDLAADGSIANARGVAGGDAGVDLSARVEPVRRRSTSCRIGPAGGTCTASTATRPIDAAGADGGRIRHAAVGLRHEHATRSWRTVGSRASMSQDGFDHLGVYRRGQGAMQTLDLPYTAISRRFAPAATRWCSSPPRRPEAAAVVRMDVATGQREVLRRSLEHERRRRLRVDARARSRFRPTAARSTAYAIYYPPANRGLRRPERRAAAADRREPRRSDGHDARRSSTWVSSTGPAAASAWSTSTTAAAAASGAPIASGCNGQWGIVDTEDCINAARYLAEQGEVDGQRLAIRGGSAGGYTTLCALVFHDDFAAGRRVLRRGRLRGAGDRHPQVRVALPGRADRPVPGATGTCTTRARRSTSPTSCRAR